MKIKANDYKPNEVFRIIREWTDLTQQEFGESINKSKFTVQSMELGRNRIYFDTLMEVAKKHGLTVTIEKK